MIANSTCIIVKIDQVVINFLVFFTACPTELGPMTVQKEYCKMTINDKTQISLLLPTTKEAGLCSYAMLDFLMRKQNDFLDKYLKETHRFVIYHSAILVLKEI
jgi:hypothetical protein